MANLTLRSVKGSPLTNAELDGNFEYFTGSHAITGSLTISGSIIPAETNGTLGTAQHPWKELFIDGATIIFISGSSSGSISFTSGSGFNFVGGNLNISGSPVVTNTGSFLTTGSNNFVGTQTVLGSILVTGSLTVSGSNTFTNVGPAIFSGSVTSTGGFTGSLQGTATTASYVETAQTASYVETAQTASYVENAQTASYVENAQTASYVENATSASYALSASHTTYAEYANGADYANSIYVTSTGIPSDNYPVIFGSATINDNASIYNDVSNLFYNPSTNRLYLSGSLTNGQSVTASGNYSHAEGIGTQATNLGAHAEGQNTIASGLYSHAEGTSQALGGWSHAEGTNTISLGYGSHAEGESTIASGSNQHVQGKYNTHGDDTSLMIVGNGTGTFARKDAFKVRMSGSIVLPTTQSAAPSWTGTDGEMVFATVTGDHYFYVWMSGAWRSGSLS